MRTRNQRRNPFSITIKMREIEVNYDCIAFRIKEKKRILRVGLVERVQRGVLGYAVNFQIQFYSFEYNNDIK